jgi:hypothetical protein
MADVLQPQSDDAKEDPKPRYSFCARNRSRHSRSVAADFASRWMGHTEHTTLGNQREEEQLEAIIRHSARERGRKFADSHQTTSPPARMGKE